VLIYLRHRGEGDIISKVDLEYLQMLIELNYSWHPKWFDNTQSYYAGAIELRKGMNGKTHRLHSVIKGTNNKVDHINHDTLDNRKENLRVVSNQNNLKNRKSKNSNNTSGYRNVFWSTKYNAWLVALQVDGKQTYFGRFKLEDVDKAGARAEEMRQEIYGEFAGES